MERTCHSDILGLDGINKYAIATVLPMSTGMCGMDVESKES